VVAKRWNLPEFEPALLERLSRETPCSALLAGLLLKRGVRGGEEAARFLAPKLLHLSDPFILPEMERAVERIETGIRRGESIAIFGDYDVDGISSTCLLLDFFRLIRYQAHCRLPHRLREGYGLRAGTVRELAALGVRLLVTVDNGSSSREEIALAGELGVDVVVCDHHQPSAEPPRPAALVNPWLLPPGVGEEHRLRELAGVGVTFKLVWALCQRLSRQKKLAEEFRRFLMDSLALVALGTIADVVPLCGENRVLARFGLQALESSRRPGIRRMVAMALSSQNGATFRPGPAGAGRGPRLEASHIGFRLGPRLNAAGRLGQAELAMRLLSTEDDEEAARLLAHLERENRRRREIEDGIYRKARERVLAEVDLERDRAIVLGDSSWHAGVIGIVAARLCEEFYRPTLLVAFDGPRGRGSARSIPQVHICDALARCREHLAGFGGHALAAGAEVEAERLAALREALQEAIPVPPAQMVAEVEADCGLALGDIDGRLLDELTRLSPHGQGNPEPLFAAWDLEVVGSPRLLGGDGKHLAFFVRQDGAAFRAVAFGKGELFPRLKEPGARVSLLFQPRWNEWQGRREIELNVREIEVEGPPGLHRQRGGRRTPLGKPGSQEGKGRVE
jgi:single-stranded-DNA-specific exonuclease